MKQKVERQLKNINNVLAIVKLASLMICAMIYCIQHFKNIDILNYKDTSYDMFISISVLAVMILIISALWSFFTVMMYKAKYPKTIQAIEVLFFISVYTCLIYSSNIYSSNLKFLFIFLIMTTTIQAGENYGISVAFLCSVIILTADLLCSPKTKINEYFQSDLILAGVFILIAWTLAYYVRSERANLADKEIQIVVLDEELQKRDKQRAHMEELITKSETCYNLLIANANDAILVHRDGRIIFCNESAVKLLGAKRSKELIDVNILEFSLHEEKESIGERMNHLYHEEKSTVTFEQRIEKSEGSIISVENTSAFCIYEGKPTILSILHDITPQKRVEKLQIDVKKSMELLHETQEFNKLITDFFANISHELKTPLNVIFSAVQLLNSMNEGIVNTVHEKQSKYLKIMKQNCYRLMRLINNILDITRADAGFLKLNIGNFNIVNLIEDITLSVVPFAESRGISIIFDTDSEEKVAAIDPDKIERIILNLLSNAIKFTDAGGQIFVSLTEAEDFIHISVKDSGIGIPNDKLTMIFDRFAQVDKTFKRNHEGSGIGLSLVKSFVEMHGGSVEIYSELGSGSEFIVKLPVRVIEEVSGENYAFESSLDRISIEFSDIYSEAV